MAIKGKSRGRSKSRSVTLGPKPTYVEPKRPLLARRWFQVTLGVVILVVAVGGVLYGLARERSQERAREERAAEVEAIGTYRDSVDQALAGVGQPAEGTFLVLPDVVDGIERLRAGGGAADDVRDAARSGERSARRAVRALDGIEPTDIVRGLQRDLVQTVIDAHRGMTSGVKLYGQVAQTVLAASQAGGAERDRLLDLAADLEPVAREVFEDGYLSYLSAQAEAGVFDPLGGGATLPTG